MTFTIDDDGANPEILESAIIDNQNGFLTVLASDTLGSTTLTISVDDDDADTDTDAIAVFNVLVSDNLIQNGSFEQIVTPNPWNYIHAIPEWTLESGPNFELQKNLLQTSADGSQYLELDAHPLPGSTAVSQTIDTVAGVTYELRFAFARRPGTAVGENALDVDIEDVGSGTALSLLHYSDPGTSGWTYHEATFTATGARTLLRFADAGTLSNTLGTFLDDVSIIRAPLIDLDVDSNNDGTIDPNNHANGTDDPIEENAPGRVLRIEDLVEVNFQALVEESYVAGWSDWYYSLNAGATADRINVWQDAAMTIAIDVDPTGGLDAFVIDNSFFSSNTIYVEGVQVGEIDLSLELFSPSSSTIPLDTDQIRLTVADVITVNSTSDASAANAEFSPTTPHNNSVGDPEITLRSAIEYANLTPGVFEVIEFAIPSGEANPSTQTFVLHPAISLPEITDPIRIDATTQQGYIDTPLVELDGSFVAETGFHLTAGNSQLLGFSIGQFLDSGILLAGAGSNVIQSMFVGVTAAGVTAGNAGTGITGDGSPKNVIGGSKGNVHLQQWERWCSRQGRGG